MKAAKKFRPNWDSAFFMERAHDEWKQAPRAESEKLPDIPFSFNWLAIRRSWENIGVFWLKEGEVMIHVVELAQWQGRLKK